MTSAQRGEGSQNAPNVLTNSINFADGEGERVKQSQNFVDVIYGSLLAKRKGPDGSKKVASEIGLFSHVLRC